MAEQPNGGSAALPLLVSPEGSVNPVYSFVKFDFEAAEEEVSTAAILITRLQERLLVALPREVWHRTAASRLLPPQSLSRAVLCEVAVALADTPGVLKDEPPMKVWIGFLDPKYEPDLKPMKDGDQPDFHLIFEDTLDGEERVPLGQALADVAEDHFSFQSAAENTAGEGLPARPSMEQRMVTLESHLEAVQTSLATLLSRGEAPVGEQKGLPEQPKSGTTPKKAAKPKAKEARGGAMDYAGLDPSVLFSARQAGVPESQLRSLSHLMQKSTKMADQPGRSKAEKKVVNAFSESEGEDEDGLLPPGDGGDTEAAGKAGDPTVEGTPVEQAVVQLTKIIGTMARKPTRDLEALLDGAEGGSAEMGGTTTGGGKSKAAAYKRLRSALSENPSYVYGRVEDLMDADFLQARSAPGVNLGATSSRAWVEHRSKVLHYPSSVRAIWTIAAIHDCLKVEARARAAVALAAWDQCSLDNGSWLMSQEVLLEAAPPYAAFQMKKLPEPAEQAASKLLDERWLAVLQWKLKDQDTYLETKKRLTQARGRGDPRGSAEEAAAQLKKKGNGKGRDGKGNPREGDALQN